MQRAAPPNLDRETAAYGPRALAPRCMGCMRKG